MAYTDDLTGQTKPAGDDTASPLAPRRAPGAPPDATTPLGSTQAPTLAPLTPVGTPASATPDPMAFVPNPSPLPVNMLAPLSPSVPPAATNPVPTTPALGAPKMQASSRAGAPDIEAFDPNRDGQWSSAIGYLDSGGNNPGRSNIMVDQSGKPLPGQYGDQVTGPARTLQGGVESFADGSAVPGGYNGRQDAASQLVAQLGPNAGAGATAAGGWQANPSPLVPGATNVPPGTLHGAAAAPGAPSGSVPGTLHGASTVTPSAPSAPSGASRPIPGATDATPSTPPGGSMLSGITANPAAPVNSQAAGDPYRGGMTATDPNNSLLGKTLLAGPETDRFKIAGDQLANWDAASEPYFQANLRSASQNAAGRGQLGSGMLRGRLGDITGQHDLERSTQGKGFLQNALTGSIDDAYKNVGIAQQQQGFQAGQQQTAFSQEVIATQVEEALRNGDFNRAATLLSLGDQGNPSDTAMALSGIFGGQANGANSALSGLIGNTVDKNAQSSSGIPPWLMEYLQSLGGKTSANQNPGADDGQ